MAVDIFGILSPVFCNIVVVKDEVVNENILIVGAELTEVNAKSEKIFLDKCKNYIFGFENYSHEEIQFLLNEGYVTFMGGSICITFPEMEKNVHVGSTLKFKEADLPSVLLSEG